VVTFDQEEPMKLTVFHSDPELLVQMAELLARRFPHSVILLDPDPEPTGTFVPDDEDRKMEET
jgi:hypothetical protein